MSVFCLKGLRETPYASPITRRREVQLCEPGKVFDLLACVPYMGHNVLILLLNARKSPKFEVGQQLMFGP